MTVLGLGQTLAAFERVQLEAAAASLGAAEAGGHIVAADMKAHAPKDTGRMADSVVVRLDGDTALVGPTVPYARFVEFGTRYMEAEPFAQPALEETKTAVEAAMAAIFKVVLR